MKTFDLYYDEQNCPTAHKIERLINDCGSGETHIEKISSLLKPAEMRKFFTACILYWAETERYDERNRYAVFASRNIVEHFPELGKQNFSNEVLKNAYAFTSCAHRYLQNELFKDIEVYIKKDDRLGIMEWFESQEFVYDPDYKSLIPRIEYKISGM